ncbi:RNA polymerase factor sigma-32 [Caulobacter sp. SLTY]|uniref:RNA polymerase factor sigma-32 n=1 Tax=Caulobacter sp. SLTY TaxID=2683262 RepID=UPI0014125D7B|nr:RNA polymerase factor sigma-32 [Caulobacter sp. SLTY]NBB14617.1 RNA polymerase factor sigma-32 [Caulobacter sp. SLTY]
MAREAPITAETAERRYIRHAMRAPMLAADHEHDLAVRWKEHQDEEALHELTSAYMRLVISMASRFKAYGLPHGDLIQEGSVGLMQAAARFEPDRAVRFSTYAGWWVRAAMQDYVLRNWSIVRTGTTAAGKSLFFNLRRLRARLGDLDGRLNPEARQKIAVELGVDVEDVEAMAARLAAGDRSLNAPVAAGADDAYQDFLADEADDPETVVTAKLDGAARQSAVARALKVLNPRELAIVKARRLSEEQRTLESLGEEMGVSKERVRQVEHGALAKLRKALESEYGGAGLAGLVG